MKKRILFVTTLPQTIKAFLLPHADYLRGKDWSVDALTCDTRDFEDIHRHFDKVWSVKFSRNPLSLSNLLSAPRLIRRIINREKYDIVHVHTPVAAFVTRFALRKIKHHRPQIIYTVHGFHFHQSGGRIKNILFRLLENIAGPWTDHFILMNEEDMLAAKQLFLSPSTQAHYVPGIGIDSSHYSTTQVKRDEVNALRRELRLMESDKIFLCIAELTKQKNHELIIKAAANLHDGSIHFVFAGTGPMRARLTQLAQKYNLQNRIHFLGLRRDIPALICASEAVILVSQREGLPRSIIEAMSLQKPVIGSNIRGIRDLLKDGRGILIQKNCVTELSQSIQYIADHPEEAKKTGARGYQQLPNYELGKILGLYENIYSSALNSL